MKKPLTPCLLAGLLFAFSLASGTTAEPVWEVKALAQDGEFEFDPETRIVTTLDRLTKQSKKIASVTTG